MIAGFVLSTLVICTSGTDSETVGKKSELRESIEREAAQYLSCKSADDCTFFPEAGGFVVNKSGLSIVMECTERFKKALFPQCFPPNGWRQPVFGMEAEPQTIPRSVTCESNKCIAVFKESEKARRWSKENRLYLKNVRNKFIIDKLCEDMLNEAGKK